MRRHSLAVGLSCASLALVLSAGRQALGQAYTVSDIGVGYCYGINNAGQVTGSGLNNHAFIWTNGVLVDLGTFGGSQSYGDKINSSGQAVGAADTASSLRHAYVYKNNMLNDLGTLGGSESDARGINDAGTVVGASYTTGDQFWRPYVYKNGVMTDLGSYGGMYGGAEGINTAGIIAGWTTDSGQHYHGFIYQNNTMTDLGSLGGDTVGDDINDHNRIVGYSDLPTGKARAFVWVSGTIYSLGKLNGTQQSYANAINNLDQIVGTCDQTVATLFEPSGPRNLNDYISGSSGWNLQRAEDINDSGKIVGWGYHNGQSRGFVLTPIAVHLDNPNPGQAGTNNSFHITGLTPGHKTYLLYSTAAGSTSIPNYCYGVTFGMHAPVIGGNAIANNNGEVTIVGYTPAAAHGHTIYYQAFELDSCRASNLVAWTYP